MDKPAYIEITRDGGRTLERWQASELELREGFEDNTNESVKWTEYWLKGKLVHRSAAIVLKSTPKE